MRKYLFLWVVFLVPSIFAATKEHNILVLHSYHQGLEWTDSISSGILSVVNKYKLVNVHFEYLDAKRNYTPEYFKKLLELYKTKAKTVKFDVVIACDNDAFNFMRNYDSLFYAGIPVVFGGVNYFNKTDIQNKKLYYGFAEKADHKGTIEAIKTLFPKRNKILIIGDNTITGEKIREEVQSCISAWNTKLSYEYFYDFTVDELAAKVSQLDKNTAIYLLVVNRDKNGQYVSYNQGLQLIFENTKVPIFSSWDFYLGKGIAGGKITKGFTQGEAMAKLSMQIIERGVDSLMPKGISIPDKYYFDYNVLQSFGKNIQSYPNAIIINKPKENNLIEKWMFVLVVILFSIILFLILILYLRRKYMKSLKKSVEEKTGELQQANNKLKILNNEKNKFLSIAAHDLRSPIGNIRNLSELMLEYQTESLPSKYVHYLEIIKRSSSYTLQLISNLLDFSIIESGKLTIEKEPILYSDFLTQMVEENAEIASLKGITIKLKKQANENPLINIDIYCIKQVVTNLIGNAIKFSSANSTIHIEISVDLTSVTTSIRDEGKGIPEKELELIFKEFEKGTSKPTNSEKGTGLGLAIAKRIIEAHNGSISVSSELNVGSIFTFKLPNK